jgi:hypothetical protein
MHDRTMSVASCRRKLFDRRSAAELYRILAAKHGVVNLDASTGKRVAADRQWILVALGALDPPARSTAGTAAYAWR